MSNHWFTFSALSVIDLVCDAYGGLYGSENGTATVSGSAQPGTATEITDEKSSIGTFVSNSYASLSNTGTFGGGTLNAVADIAYTLTATSGTINFIAASAADKFYFFCFSGNMDLRNITFNLGKAQAYNIYFINNVGGIYLAGMNYGNFIGTFVLTNGSSASVNGSITALTGYGGSGATGETMTVRLASPQYTFTFAALSNQDVDNFTLKNGILGYKASKQNVPLINSTEVTTQTTLNDEIDFLTTFQGQVSEYLNSTAYGTYVQELSTTGTYTILPISHNKWYRLTATFTATFNFTPDGPDDVFYIFNDGVNSSSNMHFDYITFNLNGASQDNIYIISVNGLFLSTVSDMYGNYISREFSTIITTPGYTLFGSVSVLDYSSVPCLVNNTNPNPTPTDNIYVTINFSTPCFMKGTKILTDRWYVPIEELKAGDMVMTYGVLHDNKFHEAHHPTPQPIINIRKSIKKASRSASPIVIVRNAFAPNKPFEQLCVSLNHGIVDHKGTLHAASNYMNGCTIYQDPTIEVIHYYHIELATHSVIMANGVLSETWREN